MVQGRDNNRASNVELMLPVALSQHSNCYMFEFIAHNVSTPAERNSLHAARCSATSCHPNPGTLGTKQRGR